MVRPSLSAWAVVAIAACGGDPGGGGPRTDADRPRPRADGGAGPDGGPRPDGSFDASRPDPDAAPPRPDGAPREAGPPPDDAAGPPPRDAAPIDAAPPDGWRMPARAVCGGGYFGARASGTLADPRLLEVSGVVPSPVADGVLWLHNDSGDTARLYAAGEDGRRLGRLVVRGVQAVDFEDIAAAPCPDRSGPCLWIADIGNNAADRTELVVYAVPEPPVSGAEPFPDRTSDPPWRFPVTFPGGEAIDSEALAVAPDATTFYLFEKVDGDRARVFAHPGPLEADRPAVLERRATFAAPGFAVARGRMITGADLHPSGRRLLLRVYTGTFEYDVDPARRLADLDGTPPRMVSAGPLAEPQGEAVAYDARGTGVWTVSEDPAAQPAQPLHHYRCRDEP